MKPWDLESHALPFELLTPVFKKIYFKKSKLHGVGFEPTRLSPYDLKSYPLDHSGIRAYIGWDSNPRDFRHVNLSHTP